MNTKNNIVINEIRHLIMSLGLLNNDETFELLGELYQETESHSEARNYQLIADILSKCAQFYIFNT